MLGRIAYQLWFRPIGWTRKVLRQGVGRSWAAARGEAAMREAAARLTPLATPAGAPYAVPVAFLTGERYWHQTLFCARSLQRLSPRPIRFRFLDDGTISPDVAARLLAQHPGAVVESAADLTARLDAALPADRFPRLRARRLVYPHLRKLVDAHAGRTGWGLVLDSDMLFQAEPTELLQWLEAPEAPVHLLEDRSYYGYSDGLMRAIAGAELPERVNVGLIGLRSESIDWALLERWLAELQRAEGDHYLQEQALTAMLLAGRPHTVLDGRRYWCNPPADECRRPTAALHHYVAESRLDLYIDAWRRQP